MRWLSPWGWSRRDLTPLLRDMSEDGLTELTEDPSGEILEVSLTDLGEREMTPSVHAQKEENRWYRFRCYSSTN